MFQRRVLRSLSEKYNIYFFISSIQQKPHALISDSVLDGLKSQHGQKMYARVKLNLNFFPVWMSEI